MEPNIIIIFLICESALKGFDWKSITLYFTICIVLNFNIILARIIAAKYLNIKTIISANASTVTRLLKSRKVADSTFCSQFWSIREVRSRLNTGTKAAGQLGLR